MTTSSTGNTQIFYTPYVGNKVPLFDGNNVGMRRFDELMVTTGDFTNNPAILGPNKLNDWFVFRSPDGTMRLCHGPDWTDNVTRSAGTILIRMEGLLLNSVAITNGPAAQRGTYVGTTYTNANSQLDWIYGAASIPPTAGWFGVWNMYFRAQVVSMLADLTTTWTYSVNQVREINSNTQAKFHFVSGLREDSFRATVFLTAASSNVSGTLQAGVGYDMNNRFIGSMGQIASTAPYATCSGSFATAAMGKHFMVACENAPYAAASVQTIVGFEWAQGGNYSSFWFEGRF
jgi:hypothetical protein